MTIVRNDLFDYNGLKIYQDDSKFKFSLDSILLAEFVDIKDNLENIVDFCTGNAPIPLILSTRSNAKMCGFELQNSIYNLAIKSVEENSLSSQIKIINSNIKDVRCYIESESVDAVTCNPPYFKFDGSSLINEDREKAIARHEIEMDLDDIFISSRYILKNKAPLYLVHRCDRLEEIFEALNKYKFGLKKIQFVYAGYKKEAIMVLIKATKNGKSGSLKVLPPIDILELKSYKGLFE